MMSELLPVRVAYVQIHCPITVMRLRKPMSRVHRHRLLACGGGGVPWDARRRVCSSASRCPRTSPRPSNAIARAQPGVQHSNALFTEHVGPNQIIAAISADFGDALSATDVERIVATVDGRARKTPPEIVAVPHGPAESRQTAISSPL